MEQIEPGSFGGFPISPLSARTSCVLHQLHVFDAAEIHLVVMKQGVGIIADIKKDFGDVRRLKNLFEGCSSDHGRECCRLHSVNVDEVDVTSRQNKDGNQ
ncbi:3'-5' exonuclease [Colletotrichum scovillei]|nr:3'-5' exonuclease [Colletotrichum scovillei]